jgi:hypothetical protein
MNEPGLPKLKMDARIAGSDYIRPQKLSVLVE